MFLNYMQDLEGIKIIYNLIGGEFFLGIKLDLVSGILRGFVFNIEDLFIFIIWVIDVYGK